jgi:hypothetical protein
LLGKPEGKTLFGRHRRKQEDNTKRVIRKYGGSVWTGFMCTAMKLAVASFKHISYKAANLLAG